MLYELTHAFAEATTNLEVLHDTIARRVTEVVKDGCGLLLLSEDGQRLDFVAMQASSAELLAASSAALANRPMQIAENPALARVLQTGRPLLSPHVQYPPSDNEMAPEYSRVAAQFRVHSRMTVALRLRDKPIGLLNLIRFRADTPPFDEQDLELAQIVADNAALAISNARSYAAERTARLAAEAVQRTLRDYQERLQRMAFDAAVAEERERHRLAVVLHDGIGQDLTLVQLKLSSIRAELSGHCLSTLDEALALLTKSASDRSTLTFELSPPVLYDLGLHAALSWLSEDLDARCGLAVALSGDHEGEQLDDTAAAIVFRATRELLMNVVKHAHVASASVHLRLLDEQHEVVVEDQGVGFDPSEVSPGAREQGFGLLSIREQISRIGGSVSIDSAVGRGTRARVLVPRRGVVDAPRVPEEWS